MIRLAVLLATALLMLLATGTAQAWTPPPATDEGLLALYQPIAQAAWPDSPCAGHELVHLHADDALNSLDANTDGLHSTGRASAATCEVWLRSSLAGSTVTTATNFCAALVHEFGHLAGFGHTGIDGDVQAPPGPWATIMEANGPSWPACTLATTPPPSAQARMVIRDMLPQPSAAWRLICTPLRHSGRCRATRRGRATRHYDVFVAAGRVTVFA